MNTEMFIPTQKKFRQMQTKIFKELLHTELPKLIRKSNRKKWLTTKDLRDDFGMSYDLQRYYREQGKLSFSQESQKIWYDADDVDQFMYQRKIESKK